jgi:hypothetical protein
MRLKAIRGSEQYQATNFSMAYLYTRREAGNVRLLALPSSNDPNPAIAVRCDDNLLWLFCDPFLTASGAVPNGIANSNWSNQGCSEVLMEIDEHRVDEISLAVVLRLSTASVAQTAHYQRIERCFVEVRRCTRPMVCFVNVECVTQAA